jgi:hypothetical protein
MKPEFTTETDLAVVVHRDCGCFWKFYFEIETDGMPVDSDRDRCAAHKSGLDGDFEAAEMAKRKAGFIRLKVRAS